MGFSFLALKKFPLSPKFKNENRSYPTKVFTLIYYKIVSLTKQQFLFFGTAEALRHETKNM